MAPSPLATAAAAAAAEEFLEVRCVGCKGTLEVERGLTEFVCPDCATPQSLPPELMPPPPPRRRALPLLRAAADARGARLPCGACGQLLSVPVGLSRCACPLCGAELAVDSARPRNYIPPSAVPLAAASVPTVVFAREERPSYAMRAGLPGVEPVGRLIPLGRTQMERPGRLIRVHQDEQEYPHHMNDREEIPVANGTLPNNSLQQNQPSIGRRIEERQVLPPNEVRYHVNDQRPSYTVQSKRPQMAHLHSVIHSDEMQDRPVSHEVNGDAKHTEMIDEATATLGNQRARCSVGPHTVSTGERHKETPTEITQQVHKHPYHEINAGGSQLYCLDLDGVVHPPINQANVQEPVDPMDDESIEWEPLQQCPPSPDCEVSVALTDTESVESEHDEEYAASPDESMSESDHPDIDRIVAGLCPSTPTVRKLPQEISDELDEPDLTTTPSVPDMSDPEHFARYYLPLEVRRALAEKKSSGFPDRLMSEGSSKASLHNLTDPEEQRHGIKGKKAGHLCVKVWTLPKDVRVPVSLNTLGLPIGENANMLINFLGALARDRILAPLTYISWKNIPKENKDVMWHIVKLKFDVDPSRELSVLRFIRNKWRVWKSQLKRKHYDSHITEEERLADRDPRVPKEQWRVLVAYWNTEKSKAISAASKASRAKSTYINKTGSKSFARIRQEESRSGDSLGNPEGSEDDYAPAMGAGPSPKDLQERSDPQAARAKRKAGDEVSTPRKRVIVTEESRPKNSQESAVLEAVRAKKRAEDEAVALRKRVIVMEENQKKLQENLARMTNAVSAMQKMMSTGGLPNQNR